MRDINIRKLNIEDAEALNEFFNTLSKHDYRLVIEDIENISSRNIEQDELLIKKQNNSGFIAGLFLEDKLIGLATITYFDHIEMLSSMCELGIVIKDSFKNKGLGTELLNFSINQAKKDKKKRIELNVQETNVNAINFYLKNGFKKTTISEDNDDKIKTIFMSLYI